MGYTLKNSAAKNSMFTAGGTAITSTTQPLVKHSTIAGVLDSSIAKSIDVGLVPSKDAKRAYTGHDNVSIIDSISNTLNGASNTVLRSPGADRNTRASVLKANALRVNKTSTAVKDGYWNPVSGRFQTTGGRIFPGTANDFASVGVDYEANVSRAQGGIHNYNYGATVATGVHYAAKTQ